MSSRIIRKLVIVVVLVGFVLAPYYMADARTPAPQIATVDLTTLIAMHPAMASYDSNMNAFKAVRPRQFIQDKARMDASKAKKIQEYRARLKVLESQVSAERKRHIRGEAEEKMAFDKAMVSLASEAVRLHLQVYRNKEAEARLQHTARLRSIKLQIDQINQQIENENATMLSDRFTTPAETSQRVAQIVNEVRQHAQAIAAGKNIFIVLDSSGFSFQQMDRSSYQNPLPESFDYSEVFTKPTVSPIARNSDEASIQLQGYYNIRRDKARIWYNHRSQILAPFRNEMANTAVLVGGVDLTLEVLNAILKNYRVDQSIQSILNSVIQSGGR